MMRSAINKIFKTTKILILIVAISLIKNVNVINETDKIINDYSNKTIDLTAMALKLEEFHYEDKYYPLDTFTGDLTGYAADCELCGGTLGCTGQNVLDRTTTYADKDYGTVYIVASSSNLKCGSIIRFEDKRLSSEPMIAIVLDRGVLGTDIDLLTESEEYASKHVGRKRITYDVLRNGWER